MQHKTKEIIMKTILMGYYFLCISVCFCFVLSGCFMDCFCCCLICYYKLDTSRIKLTFGIENYDQIDLMLYPHNHKFKV